MKAIACVSNNWGIGFNNNLLFNMKEDMLHFKENTIHKVCVMGYNTFKGLPNSKPLPNRINIVLTSKHRNLQDVIVCASLNDLFRELNNFPTDDIYVIGGEKVYNTLLPYCNEAIITKVNIEKEADTYFKNLDKLKNWEVVEKKTLNQYSTIVKYENKYPLNIPKFDKNQDINNEFLKS